jgi:ATP-dependent Lon protease
MKTVSSFGPLSLPVGYEKWTLGRDEWIALPRTVIDQILLSREVKQSPRVEVDPEPQPHAELASEHKATQPVADGPAWHAKWGAQALPDRYRVLTQFDQLDSGELLKRGQHRSADTDINNRLRSIVGELVKRGPDRLYARCADAKAGLEALELELPHFRAPLRLLRNSLALAGAAPRAVRIPPMLLLGPPGVGKTHFSQVVAQLLGVPHSIVSYDQPNAGNMLSGTDAHWSNSSSGLLFELLCHGTYANPVVLLDELDKSRVDSGTQAGSALSELHGVLEPVSARRHRDQSVGIEFDVSLVTFIATANSLRSIEPPMLSRFEVFVIEPPEPREAVETARRIAGSALKRMGMEERLRLDRKCHYVLAHLSPRSMQRTVEKAAAAAVAEQRDLIVEGDLLSELGLHSDLLMH